MGDRAVGGGQAFALDRPEGLLVELDRGCRIPHAEVRHDSRNTSILHRAHRATAFRDASVRSTLNGPAPLPARKIQTHM